MAPFRVLIDDYWARSDGSSLPGGSSSQDYVFCQIALSTLGLRAADTLGLCMVVYSSASRLPSSAQSQRPGRIYKVNITV